MTDHMNAAIEAGAEALAQHQLDGDFNCKCGHEHPNSDYNFPTWRKALLTHEAKVTLHAAEPHLRAMIAQEIRGAKTGDVSPRAHIHDAALEIASRIAEGAPRD